MLFVPAFEVRSLAMRVSSIYIFVPTDVESLKMFIALWHTMISVFLRNNVCIHVEATYQKELGRVIDLISGCVSIVASHITQPYNLEDIYCQINFST